MGWWHVHFQQAELECLRPGSRGRSGPGRKWKIFVPLRDTASLDSVGEIGSRQDFLGGAGWSLQMGSAGWGRAIEEIRLQMNFVLSWLLQVKSEVGFFLPLFSHTGLGSPGGPSSPFQDGPPPPSSGGDYLRSRGHLGPTPAEGAGELVSEPVPQEG